MKPPRRLQMQKHSNWNLQSNNIMQNSVPSYDDRFTPNIAEIFHVSRPSSMQTMILSSLLPRWLVFFYHCISYSQHKGDGWLLDWFCGLAQFLQTPYIHILSEYWINPVPQRRWHIKKSWQNDFQTFVTKEIIFEAYYSLSFDTNTITAHALMGHFELLYSSTLGSKRFTFFFY